MWRRAPAPIPDALWEAVIARHGFLAGLPAADRTLGMHWWNPPDLIPIVEVVKGERTDAHTMLRTVALLEHLGKLAVRVERDVTRSSRPLPSRPRRGLSAASFTRRKSLP